MRPTNLAFQSMRKERIYALVVAPSFGSGFHVCRVNFQSEVLAADRANANAFIATAVFLSWLYSQCFVSRTDSAPKGHLRAWSNCIRKSSCNYFRVFVAISSKSLRILFVLRI